MNFHEDDFGNTIFGLNMGNGIIIQAPLNAPGQPFVGVVPPETFLRAMDHTETLMQNPGIQNLLSGSDVFIELIPAGGKWNISMTCAGECDARIRAEGYANKQQNSIALDENFTYATLRHEFGHLVDWNIVEPNPELNRLAESAHAAALRNPAYQVGRQQAYAVKTKQEYVAELSAIYNASPTERFHPFHVGRVTNAETLRRVDPAGYRLMERIYGPRPR